jgi:hypothetical protein
MKVVAFALILTAKFAAGLQCGTYDSQMGATFDIRDLQRIASEPAYTVEDGNIPCSKVTEQNYTYLFNVCGEVSGVIPDECKSVADVATSAALQINTRGTASEADDWCYSVGQYSEASSQMSLLDDSDPTKGLSLVYAGDYCHNGVQRKFNIELICADKLNAVPTHALEYTSCSYTITMPSIYGCPLECPVSNRKLCGGNGHCAYDWDKNAARCFCNNGYEGGDCGDLTSTQTKSNYSPALLGLIITLFIIILALVASLLFMVRQLSAYKEDLANYQVLKGGDDDSSAVV